jgi:ABC-2 type transport system permease protein
MRLSLSYFKIYFLSTVRNTPALFFTLIFPPLMLLLTSHQWGDSSEAKQKAFVVFLNYSVQTVCLMLLGMGVSQEKNSEWSKYQRTLPAPMSTMVLGRMMHTLCLSLVNLVTISLIGILFLSIPVTLVQLSYFFLIALFGGIPMVLMGMTIGYAANAESSRSIFTLLNLLLLFGSFSFPATGLASYLRLLVPTYQWMNLSMRGISPEISILSPLLCLGGYTLVFAFLFQKAYFKTNKK